MLGRAVYGLQIPNFHALAESSSCIVLRMRRLPPLGALRAFEAAARHMSFKAAADELGVTPTAISHQIRQLEEICRHKLFRRRPRPLMLTQRGAKLFPVLKDGFDGFAEAIDALSGGYSRQVPLRVTTTNAFAHRWLVPRLPLWRRAHPDINLEVIGTDAIIDVLAGQADIAIRYQRSPPTNLQSDELFRDTFWPIASRSLLAAAPIRRPADLVRHTLIDMYWQPTERTPPTWRTWLERARAHDANIPTMARMGALNFREELHAIEAVIAGQGIALLSDVLVARELASGTLVKVLEMSLPGFGFYCVHVPDHERLPIIEEFHAWIRSVAAPAAQRVRARRRIGS
jgi:LysR family glycine cleavage system transcriptional activator